MATRSLPTRGNQSPLMYLIIALIILFLSARTLATFYIDYQWWSEVGQLTTWTTRLLYGIAPLLVGALAGFVTLWLVHARALKAAGTGLAEHRFYAYVSTIALFLLSLVVSASTLDPETVMLYLGSRAAGDAGTWTDPVFGANLSFHFFHVPFYLAVTAYVLAFSLAGALVYLVANRFWFLQSEFATYADRRGEVVLEFDMLRDAFLSPLLRTLLTIALVAISIRFFLNRYDLLLTNHGELLVGMDWVDEHLRLPLQYLLMATVLLAVIAIWRRRIAWLLLPLGIFLVQGLIVSLISGVYVKPNELALQKPYIERHLGATRSAFGLQQNVRSIEYPAQLEARIDPAMHRTQLENVRLWDWRAFHDTITQIQALRQYYVFRDTDVDRYTLTNGLRQVMLAPREIDIRQLSDTRANWINTHFVYTHGYGLVVADANKIERTGYPVLYIQDAPPKINTPDLKLTRPEIYYGEQIHEPVYVRTNQPEFNYPSGAENVHTRYEGHGGISMGLPLMRLAAALYDGNWNVLFTNYFTNESRMMIHRGVRNRLEKVAGFIEWDTDPYIVLTADGRQVWMMDGYTASDRHPYSRPVRLRDGSRVNYIRNSVKATVDAFDGTLRLYIFDESDPILRAWRAVLPALFVDASQMPTDLRSHVRYPEGLFRAQAESYRTYHMTNAESYYNREDVWDLARRSAGQGAEPQPLEPTYLVMQLPGESRPEYVLSQAFTPRSKDNLIGLMVARCDGENLGETVVLQLSKQSLIYGPLQIDARIDSDEVISKDLSLWNQQGSNVIRGQMLLLPIENTFLYVEPIYIQSQQARMPQLKKVVLAMGNRIIYRDTYDQAIADLASVGQTGTPPRTTDVTSTQPPRASEADGNSMAAATEGQPPTTAAADARLNEVRTHLRRYRELAAQGRWSEAGRELEAIQGIVGR